MQAHTLTLASENASQPDICNIEVVVKLSPNRLWVSSSFTTASANVLRLDLEAAGLHSSQLKADIASADEWRLISDFWREHSDFRILRTLFNTLISFDLDGVLTRLLIDVLSWGCPKIIDLVSIWSVRLFRVDCAFVRKVRKSVKKMLLSFYN